MKSFLDMAYLPGLRFGERVRYLELALLPHERIKDAAVRRLIAAGFDPEG